MNAPNPALVTARGVRRLPRAALLLLCAAYVLPGVFGRDPWRNADLAAFGQMAAIAEGRSAWWQPQLGGLPGDPAPLPHWLGAVFIKLLAPLSAWIPGLDAALAARIPFAILLSATLALVWYASYHLARTEAAQPLPLAFGGEADPVAYSRAIADGALLALMASLGLLQLGHETTPELAQLASTSLALYALALAPWRPGRARALIVVALAALAGSGAPAMALALGLAGTLVCARSRLAPVRGSVGWALGATVLAVAVAAALDTWRWRAAPFSPGTLATIARQWIWFLWPAWPLALWTLWRWRHHLSYRHLAVPLAGVAVALVANLAMAGSDRALMLGLPGLAMLAAFALPTLKRSATAAVDWFSMLFFTLAAAFVWVMYVAMHTGVPAKPAANIAKLAPGFVSRFSLPELLLGLVGSAAWLWLVRWRSGRHREALWKSLVLPAGGVALAWLLAMTLWLPVLDYARSPRAWVQRVAAVVPREACIAAPGMARAGIAALEVFGRWRVDATPRSAQAALRDGPSCDWLVLVVRSGPLPLPPEGWQAVAVVQRPTDREERTQILRRIGRA